MTDEQRYELVMPFVVTSDNGGVYDADSFVAGMRTKDIWVRCEVGENPIVSYEPTPLVPQLDLVAMHFGYVLSQEPWWEHPEEWTKVELRKAGAGADG